MFWEPVLGKQLSLEAPTYNKKCHQQIPTHSTLARASAQSWKIKGPQSTQLSTNLQLLDRHLVSQLAHSLATLGVHQGGSPFFALRLESPNSERRPSCLEVPKHSEATSKDCDMSDIELCKFSGESPFTSWIGQSWRNPGKTTLNGMRFMSSLPSAAVDRVPLKKVARLNLNEKWGKVTDALRAHNVRFRRDCNTCVALAKHHDHVTNELESCLFYKP